MYNILSFLVNFCLNVGEFHEIKCRESKSKNEVIVVLNNNTGKKFTGDVLKPTGK
jgi:hypothetical protein